MNIFNTLPKLELFTTSIFVQRLLLGLLVVVFSACGQQPTTPTPGFDPKNAFGPAGTLPTGATQVSPEEFLKLQKTGSFHWVNPAQQKLDKANAQTAQLEADNAIKTLLVKRPNLSKRILNEPSASDPNVKPSNDGNYLLSLTDNNGEAQQVVTMGKASRMRWIAGGIKNFRTSKNQTSLYNTMYAALPARFHTRFPAPSNIANLSVAQLEAFNLEMAKALKTIGAGAVMGASLNASNLRVKGGTPPPGYVTDPTLEEGAGKGSDHAGKASCATHKAQGIYANFDWSLKFFATSVKTQGKRGTCVAFGITAALESEIALKLGRWVNLSEQDLYNKMHMVWEPQDYGDGAQADDTLEQMAQTQYVIPFETAWNYNPSWQRFDDKDQEAYFNSCSGYLEICSDTTHQGYWICTFSDSDEYCGYVAQATTGAFDTSSAVSLLWDIDTDLEDEELNLMFAFLSAGYPVAMSSKVTYSFSHPDANGFVNYLPDQDNEGGHEFEVTGFITNDTLQSILPNAPLGSGGGYFIVKNSWSICFGDAGYIYIPFDYIRDYGEDAYALAPIIAGNQAPNLEITAPNNGTHIGFGGLNIVHLSATSSDLEDGASCCDITWTSDKDGFLGKGKALDFTFTTPGTRIVTATAKDSGGVSRSDAITLIADNGAPSVKIITPKPNQQLTINLSVVLDGEGSDPNEIGFLLPCSSLNWTSDKDGFLGTGCTPTVKFSTTGTRVITLTGKDSQQATATAKVTINVVNPPVSGPPIVNILNPVNNQVFNKGDITALKFNFTDPGATIGALYSIKWTVKVGASETIVVPKYNGFFNTFIPSDYLPSSCGFTNGELWVYVLDPEGLTGSSHVKISVNFGPC